MMITTGYVVVRDVQAIGRRCSWNSHVSKHLPSDPADFDERGMAWVFRGVEYQLLEDDACQCSGVCCIRTNERVVGH